jgi:anti-sigma factor RsiW
MVALEGSVMNTNFCSHIPEDMLEKYALGSLSDAKFAPLDEHLLICPACQTNLQTVSEYIAVMKAATAAVACEVIGS